MRRFFKRFIALFLAISFLAQTFTYSAYGQLGPLNLAPALNFQPALLRYLSVNTANPYNYFNFLLDLGDNSSARNDNLSAEAKKLIHYFFLGLTLPSEAFWVNLRPDQPGKITSEELAKTDLGKTLLEQDLQLKKDAAKYLHPAHPKGKEFWEKLYAAIGKDKIKKVKIATSNRVWIVPDEAVVMETEDGALVASAKLKVLLENEYFQTFSSLRPRAQRGGSNLQNAIASSSARNDNVNKEADLEQNTQLLSERLMKEIILPALTDEINNGANYAPLRQIYHSLILAEWYKRKFATVTGHFPSEPKGSSPQESVPFSNPYSDFVNKSNLKGLESALPWSKQALWQEYLESYSKGEYKEEAKIFGLRRMYWSGGIILAWGEPGFKGQEGGEGANSGSPLKIITARDSLSGIDSIDSRVGTNRDFMLIVTSGNSVYNQDEGGVPVEELILPQQNQFTPDKEGEELSPQGLPAGQAGAVPENTAAGSPTASKESASLSNTVFPEDLKAINNLKNGVNKIIASALIFCSFIIYPVDALGSRVDDILRPRLIKNYLNAMQPSVANHYRKIVGNLNRMRVPINESQLKALEIAETDGKAQIEGKAKTSKKNAEGPFQVTKELVDLLNDYKVRLKELKKNLEKNNKSLSPDDAFNYRVFKNSGLLDTAISWSRVRKDINYNATIAGLSLAMDYNYFNRYKLVPKSYDKRGRVIKWQLVRRSPTERTNISAIEAMIGAHNAGRNAVIEALCKKGPVKWKEGLPEETRKHNRRFIESALILSKYNAGRQGKLTKRINPANPQKITDVKYNKEKGVIEFYFQSPPSSSPLQDNLSSGSPALPEGESASSAINDILNIGGEKIKDKKGRAYRVRVTLRDSATNNFLIEAIPANSTITAYPYIELYALGRDSEYRDIVFLQAINTELAGLGNKGIAEALLTLLANTVSSRTILVLETANLSLLEHLVKEAGFTESVPAEELPTDKPLINPKKLNIFAFMKPASAGSRLSASEGVPPQAGPADTASSGVDNLDEVRLEIIKEATPYLKKVVATLEKYRKEGIIERYGIFGSFLRGDFDIPLKDIDVFISLAKSEKREDLNYYNKLGDISEEVVDISLEASKNQILGSGFHFNLSDTSFDKGADLTDKYEEIMGKDNFFIEFVGRQILSRGASSAMITYPTAIQSEKIKIIIDEDSFLSYSHVIPYVKDLVQETDILGESVRAIFAENRDVSILPVNPMAGSPLVDQETISRNYGNRLLKEDRLFLERYIAARFNRNNRLNGGYLDGGAENARLDFEHTRRVLKLTEAIAQLIGADVDAAIAAALLHDITKGLGQKDSLYLHPIESAKEAGGILKDLGKSEEFIKKVQEAILFHAGPWGSEDNIGFMQDAIRRYIDGLGLSEEQRKEKERELLFMQNPTSLEAIALKIADMLDLMCCGLTKVVTNRQKNPVFFKEINGEKHPEDLQESFKSALGSAETAKIDIDNLLELLSGESINNIKACAEFIEEWTKDFEKEISNELWGRWNGMAKDRYLELTSRYIKMAPSIKEIISVIRTGELSDFVIEQKGVFALSVGSPVNEFASSAIKQRKISEIEPAKKGEVDESLQGIIAELKKKGILAKGSANKEDLKDGFASLGIDLLSLRGENIEKAVELIAKSSQFTKVRIEQWGSILLISIPIKEKTTVAKLEEKIRGIIKGLTDSLTRDIRQGEAPKDLDLASGSEGNGASSPFTAEKKEGGKEGGIDLSQIELTLKDEKFVSSLNPADLKVLRAAKALGNNWGSLSLLYVHEIMLLLTDNLVKDLENKELLQNVLQQLQIKSFLDLQAAQFLNLIQSQRPISEIKLTLSK